MRLRALIAATLAPIALAGALGGCGSSAVVVGPLAQAADVTGHVGGAHMQLSARIEGAGFPQSVAMSGGGFFNFRSHEGSFSIQMSGLPTEASASGATIEELFKGSNLYIASSLFTGKLPGGARWMKVDLAKVGEAAGFDPSQLLSGQSNPAQILEYLKASGASVTIVGHDRIRGVPTTHYTAEIDLAKAAAALSGANTAAVQKAIGQLGVSELPVDVWVDSHNLVRRMQLDLRVPAGSQSLQMQMDIELFGFGATRTVSAPAPSETFDATSTALGGLGVGTQ